jgi:hypothetical protein
MDGVFGSDRPYEGRSGNIFFEKTILEPGESIPIPFTSDEVMPLGADSVANRAIGALRVFVMGWIEYADEAGIKRRAAFCREFLKKDVWGDGRFYAVEDPDYEHEE